MQSIPPKLEKIVVMTCKMTTAPHLLKKIISVQRPFYMMHMVVISTLNNHESTMKCSAEAQKFAKVSLIDHSA